MIKCVDLFSGCGGLSLGFEKAGIEILSAIDNWDKAVEIYNSNFNHKCYQQDIKDEKAVLEIINRYKPNMIMGGPPCQDFSSAGKRDESLGRADLTYSFANIICKYKPKWFVMENVDRIRKSAILSDVIEQYQKKGYGLTAVIIDASYCNTPQARKRFFLIGELGGVNNALLPRLKQNLNSKPMTIRDYLGDKLGVDYYYRHPRNYNRRGIFSIDEPSPTVRGVNRPVPSGYKKHSGDPKEIELSEVRPLTTIERSYLQTFPEDFKFFGTKTNLEQMIGNAVPVNLAEFLGLVIWEYEEEKMNQKTIQQNLFSNDIDFLIPKTTLHRMS
jgi:DNA (cytosine-5)-methyltransferase 1